VLNRWLQSIWYGGGQVPLTFRLLALLFGAVVRTRAALYRRGWLRSTRLAVPVIVIGNITVGGTGKTPLTLWLAGQLTALGLRVGIVLRGFGGTARVAMLVDADSSAAVVGDEALLLQQRSGCAVAIGRDRAAAAQLLIAQGVQLLIADDGMQHYALQRDVEIAVIDGVRGCGNARLLPAGPLREPLVRLQTATLVVQNGGDALIATGALRMQLAGDMLSPLAAGSTLSPLPLDTLSGRPVHAIAAIGNPGRFFALLRSRQLQVIEHAWPDHAQLQARDLQFGDALPVLMTEKDAVKCREFAALDQWFLPVTAQFSSADEQLLIRRVCMDAKLLDILVCPLCKGPLQHERASSELICRADRLAFPVRDGIPVMLEDEARTLNSDDPLLTR
jgi:tetraacyldisaccharide 4'-kinase